MHFPFYFTLKIVAALCVLCQPLLKNCLNSILVYNAMHWKFYFVLRACEFKYILDYDLSQGSIHLSAECSSCEARQHLPTCSTLSTRIIPLTMWTFLRTGRQVPLGNCSRQPSSCPTTDRAGIHKWNERRQQVDKSRILSWQV